MTPDSDEFYAQSQDRLEALDRVYGDYLDAVYGGGPIADVLRALKALKDELGKSEGFYEQVR